MSVGDERLRKLSAALRGEMPAGFVWDYTDLLVTEYDEFENECGSHGCALGLAKYIFPDDGGLIVAAEQAAKFFDMPLLAANDIFYAADLYAGCQMNEVQPEDVADMIDQWLATRKLPLTHGDH